MLDGSEDASVRNDSEDLSVQCKPPPTHRTGTGVCELPEICYPATGTQNRMGVQGRLSSYISFLSHSSLWTSGSDLT